MRRPRQIGKSRWVALKDLRVGMQLTEHILGRRGVVLVQAGEVLTQKHLEQIAKWDSREGLGRLSHYTRGVWAHQTDASGDERPACELDPYEAVSVQRNYRAGTAVRGPQDRRPESRTILRLNAANQRMP